MFLELIQVKSQLIAKCMMTDIIIICMINFSSFIIFMFKHASKDKLSVYFFSEHVKSIQ